MDELPEAERAVLGSVVRQLRARAGLSQEAVALAAGVNRKFVGDLERGARRASFDGLLLVLRAMDVTLVEFAELYEADAARVSTASR